MALIVNGVDIPDGSPLFVDGIQVEAIEVDGIPVWGAVGGPGLITDFKATDDRARFIIMSWTPTTGEPSPHYDLFENGTKVAENIQPGYQHIPDAPGTYTYWIRAYNSAGETFSNQDEGTALPVPPGDVTIDYDSVSGTNPETVTGGNGSFVFTTPDGIEEITVCMVGAGGSGGIVDDKSRQMAGGGHAGEYYSATLHVEQNESINITIGKGGTPRYGDETGDVLDGYPGEASVFGSYSTVAGGEGGNSVWEGNCDKIHYTGRGDPYISPCNGLTYYDGTNYHGLECPSGNTAYGGQASALGSGGNGNVDYDGNGGDGGPGAGGGGLSGGFDHSERSGAGGNGRVVITW